MLDKSYYHGQQGECFRQLEKHWEDIKHEFDSHPNKVFLDPGIGFGKDDSANLYLIERCMKEALTIPLLVGLSRKSFIGRLLDLEEPLDRDPPSKMLEISLMMSGVEIVRTHEVKQLAYMKNLLTN